MGSKHSSSDEHARCWSGRLPLLRRGRCGDASRGHDRLFGARASIVVRCRPCGMHYTNPRPTFQSLGTTIRGLLLLRPARDAPRLKRFAIAA